MINFSYRMLFLRRRPCLLLFLVACATAATVAQCRANQIPATKDSIAQRHPHHARHYACRPHGISRSKRGLTPNLDALARQSVVFTRAYSQVPLTTASHATILTGTYPQFHQVNDFGVPLAEDLPYAPDIFHSNGYHTAAFVGSLVLDPQTRSAPGFDRGFDT